MHKEEVDLLLLLPLVEAHQFYFVLFVVIEIEQFLNEANATSNNSSSGTYSAAVVVLQVTMVDDVVDA